MTGTDHIFVVTQLASEVLGKTKARHWFHQNVDALGRQKPIDLLRTEYGCDLVKQTLLQIKYGIY